MDLKCFTEMF